MVDDPDEKLPNTDLTFREAIECIKKVIDDYGDCIKKLEDE